MMIRLITLGLAGLIGACANQHGADLAPTGFRSCAKTLVAGDPASSEGHSYPAWSPDGRYIAFTSQQNGNYDIYALELAGGAVTRLTDHPAVDAHPSWSPDSAFLSFDSTREGNRDGFVVAFDGCGEENVTANPANDGPLSWHRDGRQVLFNSDRGGEDQVYRSTLIGTDHGFFMFGAHRLTAGPGRNQAPSFHPQGEAVLFESRRDGNREQYVMNPDGTAPRNLTRHPAADFVGRWSPQGDWISFWSNRSGNDDIYLIRPDSGELRPMTEAPTNERMPAWSPDGMQLVFASDRTGRWELFVMTIADRRVRQLTCGLEACSTP